MAYSTAADNSSIAKQAERDDGPFAVSFIVHFFSLFKEQRETLGGEREGRRQGKTEIGQIEK